MRPLVAADGTCSPTAAGPATSRPAPSSGLQGPTEGLGQEPVGLCWPLAMLAEPQAASVTCSSAAQCSRNPNSVQVIATAPGPTSTSRTCRDQSYCCMTSPGC